MSMRFLDELKRRKVVRVAAVYAATAFVVLQAADLILPRLGVPEWAMSLIVVLVLAGFAVALVLAWVLEVTPDGLRVTASLGVLALEFDLDWRVAELALRRAVELKPSYAMAHNWLADALVFTGRAEESLVHRFRAREQDPISPVQAGARVWALAAAGRWAEASAEFRALEPGLITTTETLLIAAAHARELGFGVVEAITYTSEWARRIGRAQPEAEASLLARAIVEPARRHDALALLQRLEAEAAPAWDLAVLRVALGDHENALRLLERSLAEGDPQVVLTTAQPTFDPLRADPRFVAILRALRVPSAMMSGSAAAPPSTTTSSPRDARPALVQPR